MSASANHDWNPEQYGKFADERSQPFHDLIALVKSDGIARAVDLGCGTGELTAVAAARLHIGDMLGIDSSPSMLEGRRRTPHRRSASWPATSARGPAPGSILSWPMRACSGCPTIARC